MACQAVDFWTYKGKTRGMPATNQQTTMAEVKHDLARNLKRIRSEKGVAQERLALDAGVDRTVVSKIEREVGNPGIETLLKLANQLNVTIVELLAPEH